MSAIPPLVLSLPHILIYLSSYTVSYFTITHKLYLYDKKDPVALFLFALTFAFASHTLLLLFIDGAAPSLLPAPSRRVLWHVDVYMQLCLVGFFVPVYASWTVVKQSRPMWSVKRRLAASCALALALEVVAARIAARLPSPPPLPPPDALAEENAWEAAAATLRAWWPPGAMVRRLSVLGVLLNAPLSGYGSVHLPHSLMDAFAVPVRARDVDELARRVKDTEALARDAESRGGSTGEKTSLRRRGGGGAPGTSSGFAADASRLWHLHALLTSELDDLRRAAKRYDSRGTLRGRVWNAAGCALSVVGVVKFCLALYKFVLARAPGRDLASRVADVIDPSSRAEASSSSGGVRQMLSLLYVGFVSANSLRGFLKTLSKFVAFASSASSSSSSSASSAAASRGKPGGDHALMVLLLAMLTGTYLLTSTVLLRAKLPEHARGNATAVLGMSDARGVALLHRFFDGLYVLGALGGLGSLRLSSHAHAGSMDDDATGIESSFNV